ncbi:MAG: FtsX-like permease family protein [Candidatus Saccharimonadales bacterium]
MKITDTVRRAGRSLRHAKARTLLTSLAIGVGAFTITLSLAGGQGGRQYADAIVNSNTDVRELLVSKQSKQTSAIAEYKETGPGAVQSAGPFASAKGLEYISSANLADIEKIDGVDKVTPNYSPSVNYITTTGQKKYQATVSTFSPSVTLTYAAGSVSGDLGDDGIILGEDYAKVLGFTNTQDAIGKTVSIGTTKQSTLYTVPQKKEFNFVVRGVSSASGLAFRSQGSLLVTDAAAKEMYDYINTGTPLYNKFFIVSVHVANANDAQKVKDVLVGQGYTAQTAADILGTINTFINVLLGVLLGFGALAVLTSIFGIINTQYISVLERTQQIGLMKALGMSRRDVGRLFKYEAAWIGFLGGAIGSGLAFVVGTIANPYISDALGLKDIYLLAFTPLQIIAVIVGLIVVSVGAGILPARKASKLDPIEALRTE